MRLTVNTIRYEFSHRTPPAREGCQGIAKKAAENTAVALAALVVAPLGCAAGAVACCAGALGCMTGAVVCCAAAIGCAAGGILGLLAVPVIAVKDLTHHTYRVLSHTPAERHPPLKKTQTKTFSQLNCS